MQRFEFESAKFLPYLPEDCQANPGAYGFELALWLSQALMRQGLPTSYPLGEDWGWFIEYIAGDAEFMIGCGSQADEGDGYKGAGRRTSTGKHETLASYPRRTSIRRDRASK